VRIPTDAQSDQLNRSVQAKAFTAGQDIFFREGAYEPGSRPGQELIAHELTHVVQQSGAIQASEMIQRDVGFEFETDWGVHGGSDPKKKSKPPLKKHHSYKDYGDFEVQVDEASRGIKDEYSGVGHEIEFVVKPHKETDEGGEKLGLTMNKLLEVVREMEQKGGQYALGFKLREPGEKLWVFPEAKEKAKNDAIKGSPQATIGLSLAAIHEYGTIEEKSLSELNLHLGKTFNIVRRGMTLGSAHERFEAIAKKTGEIKGASSELKGLVTLIVFYIHMFHEKEEKPADYAKSVMPILAKTNFAAMFRQLAEAEKGKYEKDPKKFSKLVIEVTQSIGHNVKKQSPVIPPGRVSRNMGDLTLQRWLESIPERKDYLTEQYNDELFGFGNLGGKEGEVGKGEKMDRTPQDKAAMVLEFRRGFGGIQVPANQWKSFAFDYFHLVRRLHGSEK
jgi:hypothetical protein